MKEKRVSKACNVCKHRKKRCTGELPCDYCTRIGRTQECVYHSKVPSKTVKVTERYILGLKTRIEELEQKLNHSGSPQGPGESVEGIPIASSEEYSTEVFDEVPVGSSETSLNLGDSACAKYLIKIRQSLVRSCHIEDDTSVPNFKTITVETSPSAEKIEAIAAESRPSIENAEKWIDAASNAIGADYMFIESDYKSTVLAPLIYNGLGNNLSFIDYASELTRFFSYLALGRMFIEHSSKQKSRSKFPGLIYFETVLKLQGELLGVSDRTVNGSLVQSFLYAAYYALSLDKSSLASILVGCAIRMMFGLGFHKHPTTAKENRIFWLCYIYDRLVAVRFGFPLNLDDLDVDVLSLPLVDEKGYYSVSLETCHFVSQVKLARITTRILRSIYTKNSISFIQNCNAVLKELKTWFDDLPQNLILDLDDFNIENSRSTVNLHINYNYLIIITTRPALFYVFNKMLDGGKDEKKPRGIIQVLVDSCVQAAHLQSVVLAKLYHKGSMAKASFLDCHYIFNATIILILAAFCQSMPYSSINLNCDLSAVFDRVQFNLNLLQKLSKYNISASNFNRQLTEIIDLLSSKEVQSRFDGVFSTFEGHREPNEAVRESIEFESLGRIDLGRVLDDISDSNSSGLALFDDEDFMRFSNSLF